MGRPWLWIKWRWQKFSIQKTSLEFIFRLFRWRSRFDQAQKKRDLWILLLRWESENNIIGWSFQQRWQDSRHVRRRAMDLAWTGIKWLNAGNHIYWVRLIGVTRWQILPREFLWLKQRKIIQYDKVIEKKRCHPTKRRYTFCRIHETSLFVAKGWIRSTWIYI